MLWRRELQYASLWLRLARLVAVPQTDSRESPMYQWQILRHSGRETLLPSRSGVIVLILPPCARLAPQEPHRLATVDEPGWRALSASLDAAATVACSRLGFSRERDETDHQSAQLGLNPVLRVTKPVSQVALTVVQRGQPLRFFTNGRRPPPRPTRLPRDPDPLPVLTTGAVTPHAPKLDRSWVRRGNEDREQVDAGGATGDPCRCVCTPWRPRRR